MNVVTVMNPDRPSWILPTIVFAQFACTSLWFAGNAISLDLIQAFNLSDQAIGTLTSAVQFGFIIGTLVYAILALADRLPPSWVFFISAILGAFSNIGILAGEQSLWTISIFRFLTGFFLAGIYPVGMKIASDYYKAGLGQALGFLVGALVVGTAFPHLLKGLSGGLPWKLVLVLTSFLAFLGGISILLLVPNGPYRKKSPKVDLLSFGRVFQVPNLRAAALGYFGHMWELYALWAFTPFLLQTYATLYPLVEVPVSVMSFWVIGVGGLACVISGYYSLRYGPKKVALWAMYTSLVCCIVSPLFFLTPFPVFIGFLLIWGMAVVADSPLLSTLVAASAPDTLRGTALTIVTCIGFLITIGSIQLLSVLQLSWSPDYLYHALAIGPFLGILGLRFLRTAK